MQYWSSSIDTEIEYEQNYIRHHVKLTQIFVSEPFAEEGLPIKLISFHVSPATVNHTQDLRAASFNWQLTGFTATVKHITKSLLPLPLCTVHIAHKKYASASRMKSITSSIFNFSGTR